MNASDFTFGIEIETLVLADVIGNLNLTIGRHGHGVQVPQFPAGWTAQQDSSLHPRAGFVGVEFVSPVLRGVDGLQQARQVVETLNAWGCQVNKSCGFHVHVGFKSNDLRALRRLVHLCAYYEPAIYAATGTRSREHGDFCKPIKGSFRHLDFSARNITGGERHEK